MSRKALTIIIILIPLILKSDEVKPKKFNYSIGPAILWQNSIYKGMDNIFLPLPFITFSYGDKLNFSGLGGSYKIYSSKKSEYRLNFGIRFSGFDPDKSDYLKGMRERKTQFNISNSYQYDFSKLFIGAKISFDINNSNNGYETEVFLGKKIFYKGSMFNFRIKGIYESSERANLNYGVYKNEILPERPYYKPDDVMSFGADAFYTKPVGKNNNKFLFFMVSYKRLNDRIVESPIIDSKSEITSFGGMFFKF
ncbi:MAG: MipA/OmpV family protein [Elusimicrobia bacterium]|nr:MipA/OmpV family protein [Elusimicrobiota bacterium]